MLGNYINSSVGNFLYNIIVHFFLGSKSKRLIILIISASHYSIRMDEIKKKRFQLYTCIHTVKSTVHSVWYFLSTLNAVKWYILCLVKCIRMNTISNIRHSRRRFLWFLILFSTICMCPLHMLCRNWFELLKTVWNIIFYDIL